MRINYTQSFCILLCMLYIHVVSAQDGNVVGNGTFNWHSSGLWPKRLALQPDSSIDKVEFARQYKANPTFWDKALTFLKTQNLDSLPVGKYVIDGEDVFADITDNPSSPLMEAKWHSHRKYCDIQYVIRGEEQLGIAPVAGAPITIPFNDKGDSQFYSQDMKGKYYAGTTQTFFILFPSDVHRPFIKVEGAGAVKRIRFKVRSR